MNPALPKRLLLLAGVAVVLIGILVVRWIGAWGLVTIHVKDAPLGKVMAAIARQGGVAVEGSLDAAKPVSLDVDKVTPAEAVDTLSVRADGDWRVAYLAAPKKEDLDTALVSLRTTGKLPDWTTHFYPTPPLAAVGGNPSDPRLLRWKAEGPGMDLPQLLDEAAQKCGIMTASPKGWSPTAPLLPKPAVVGKALPSLVSSVHGKTLALFLLTPMNRWGGPPSPGGRGETDEDQGRGQRRGEVNKAWMAQRIQAQIENLPPEEQAAAKKEADEMEAIRDQIHELPREQQRDKWQEVMSNPEVSQSMEERRGLRDSKMTREQRVTRAVSYINRKTSLQSSQNSGGTSR